MKRVLSLISALIIITGAFAQQYPAVMPLRQQAETFNHNLEWKLDNLLPGIMKNEGLDMWVIINFEYSEDPVYRTLNTWPGDGARRLSILIFNDAPDGFKKLSATWHGPYASGYMYEGIFTDRESGAEAQFTAVADYIRKADPKKIGINYDNTVLDDFSHANGLSHLHYERLYNALDKKYRDRLVSAKSVVRRWFETRSPLEISLLKQMTIATHTLINEFYSTAVITPDVSTATEVKWWIVEKIKSLGYDYWFFPSLDIIRSPENLALYGNDGIIRRGDLLHCDVGISYMGLTTDMQHLAYVCRVGEEKAPAGLTEVYKKGLRFQQIALEEMIEGRSGNEILNITLKRGKAEGLNPVMYSHPINYFGHGSGMTIGMTEKQEFLAGSGEHTLYNNTTYALEFNVTGKVPEWNNQDVTMGLEEDMIFSNGKAWLIDGYPQELYLIK